MRLTRRRFLEVAAAVPACAAIAVVGVRAAAVVLSAPAAFRPLPDGTSATRCARCGRPDHAMLDPICPAAPRVI